MKNRLLCAMLCAALGLSLAACSGSGGAGLFGASQRPGSIDSDELQFQPPQEGDPVATIATSLGDISVVLYPQYAPLAVENFTALAQQGYFDGIVFHRVEKDFIIQSGDATGTGRSGASIWGSASYPNEITGVLRHYAGALATANASDGSVGNLSQFYIVSSPAGSVDRAAAATLTEAGREGSVVNAYRAAGGAPYLDGLDTVFGQVYSGMEVVDAINAVETDDSGRPLEDVAILSVTVGAYSAAAQPQDASGTSPQSTAASSPPASDPAAAGSASPAA